MIGTAATAAYKSVKRSECRLKRLISTFTFHGQYKKSLVDGLSHPNAENTEETYRTLQSDDQLLQHEMAHCFRIVAVVACIKPLTIIIYGGFFSPALLPGYTLAIVVAVHIDRSSD